jgi:hypothetical protein
MDGTIERENPNAERSGTSELQRLSNQYARNHQRGNGPCRQPIAGEPTIAAQNPTRDRSTKEQVCAPRFEVTKPDRAVRAAA